LRAEIAAFAAAVRGEKAATVTGTEGRHALAIALEINARIAERLARLAASAPG
jgi:hypothetical protein